MSEHIDVAVIGGGQAGLSVSYFLGQQGRNHIVLEQQRIGEAWRSGKWDSFTLVTPNWAIALPGFEYSGPEPDAYMPRADVVGYLERYSNMISAPIMEGVKVTSVEYGPSGQYLVKTDSGDYVADNVVVATGAFQSPKLPPMAAALPKRVHQLHSSQYRNPNTLPAGAVLVVGSGQSGCQIAEELYQSGRKVYLTVGGANRLPRRYRGRDCFWWLNQMKFFDRTVEQMPSPEARFAANPLLTGKNGGHALNLHKFARDGVVLLGRLLDIVDNSLLLAPDLVENMAKSDAFSSNFLNGVDTFVNNMGMDVPPDEETRALEMDTSGPVPLIEKLDVDAEGISTVIWACGYSFDFSWVHFPIFDDKGYPVQHRGVTQYPGLYFMGLQWMHKPKSSLLMGVGEDAEYVTQHIAARYSE